MSMGFELDAFLAAALARGPMSPEERAAQRSSYVLGEAGIGSDADEAAYRASYRRGDTDEMARLDAEAERRVAAAKAILDGGMA